MSYSNNKIIEILISADKIGVAKTSRLFNISRSTIYSWKRESATLQEEKIKINKSSKNLNQRKMVLRRVFIKNDLLKYYIYNLKDLSTGLEFNGIAYRNNYQTPVLFLKYILTAYLTNTTINSFQVLLKGFAKTQNLQKFDNILASCKIEMLKVNDRFTIDSFDKKQLSAITDEKHLIELLSEEQISYNVNKNGENNLFTDLVFHQPIVLDSFNYSQFSTTEKKFASHSLLAVLEGLMTKANSFLQETRYNLAWKNLEILRIILNKFSNKNLLMRFYAIKIEFYTIQGSYKEALDFMAKELPKIKTETYKEIRFFILLNVCKIHLRSYNSKKFKHYFNKLKSLYSDDYSHNVILDFHILSSKEESVHLPSEESIILFENIISTNKNKISEKKLFSIYIEIAERYGHCIKFKEAHTILAKAFDLPFLQKDKYFLCEYYKLKARLFHRQGLFDEEFQHANILEKISKEYGYKLYFFESKNVRALNYLEKGQYESAKIEAENLLSYGEMTTNNHIILKACCILLRYYLRVENYKKAIKINLKEIQVSRLLLNKIYEGDAINNHCALLLRLPDKEQLPLYIDQFEKINRLLKNPNYKIRILIFKGYHAQSVKKYESALKYYKKALQLAKKGKNYNPIHSVYSFIATVKRELKEFKSAVFNINQSIYYYRLNSNKYDLPRLTFIKAKIYFEAKQYNKTEIYLQEAKELSEKYKNNFALKLCHELEERLSHI